jgi:hypothetical protein
MRPRSLAHVALFAVLAGLASVKPVAAQSKRDGGGKGAGAAAVRPMRPGVKAPPLPGSKVMDKMARRINEFDRLERMTPEQRKKALDRLPPERRQRIEQGLEQYHNMNPENKERLRNFARLPEEQREAIRQNFRRMQDLPPGRRAMVRRELQVMRDMPAADRDSRMQSEQFRRRFDSSEQNLIRDTIANLPPE